MLPYIKTSESRIAFKYIQALENLWCGSALLSISDSPIICKSDMSLSWSKHLFLNEKKNGGGGIGDNLGKMSNKIR